MKAITLFAVFLLLGGCFPTPDLWEKDGATYDQTEADWATCTTVMEKYSWNEPFAFPRKILYDCMKRKGYIEIEG